MSTSANLHELNAIAVELATGSGQATSSDAQMAAFVARYAHVLSRTNMSEVVLGSLSSILLNQPEWRSLAQETAETLPTSFLRPLWTVGGIPEYQMRTFVDHKYRLRTIAISPDETIVITGGDQGLVHVREVASGKILAAIEDFEDVIIDCCVSPDNRLLAVCGLYESLKVYELATGELVHEYEDVHYPTACVYTPDGSQLLVTNDEKHLFVLDAHSARVIADLDGHMDVDVSADGERILTTIDRVARIYNRTSGEVLSEVAFPDVAQGCAFAPVGDWFIVSCEDGNLYAYRSGESAPFLTIDLGHGVFRCDVSSDGQWIVAFNKDHELVLYDAATGEKRRIAIGHSDQVWGAIFSSNDLLVTASLDKTAKLWDMQVDPRLNGHTKRAWGLALNEEGNRLVTGALDGGVRVWDSATGQILHTVETNALISDCVVLPSGEVFVAYSDKRIFATDLAGSALWQVEDSISLRRFRLHPDGKILVGVGVDKIVYVWDTENRTLRHLMVGHHKPIQDGMFDTVNRQLVTLGFDKEVIFWDYEGGRQLRTLDKFDHTLVAGAISPEADLMVAAWQGTKETGLLWINYPQMTHYDVVEYPNVIDIAFSPDGAHLLMARSDGHVSLWSRRGDILAEVIVDEAMSKCIWHPDGKTAYAVGRYGTHAFRVGASL